MCIMIRGKLRLGSDKVNIEEIKGRVKKNELLPSCDLIDLSSDVEYLLSIIEQAEKAIEWFANDLNWDKQDYKGSAVYTWDGDYSKPNPMEVAKEFLQAIRGK